MHLCKVEPIPETDCKCVLETYSDEPTVWFLLRNGFIEIQTNQLPFERSDGATAFHKPCDVCGDDTFCVGFQSDVSDLPAPVLQEKPEPFDCSTVGVCEDCISRINTIIEQLIHDNATELISVEI